MVKDIIYHIRLSKHYWRSVPLAELSELYLSRFLRTIATSMISLFVIVYLYQKGYSVEIILCLIGGYNVIRIPFSLLAAHYIAWAGPKQVTLVSNILIIPSLWALVVIDQYTFLSVMAYFIFQGLSYSLYYIASDVQFSSIKDDGAVGKQVGWLHIAERIGTGVAPAVGGFMAYMFGPQFVIWVAALLSVLSALPLFMSPDTIRRKQKVIFQGFPLRRYMTQLGPSALTGADYITSTVVWVLFIAITVFGVSDNSVYAKLGAVFSITLVASIVSSHLYGILIDRRRSRELFMTGVIVNSIIHTIRPFITTPVGVGTTNIINEVGTSAYAMPYVQGTYDVVDSLPGYRVVYMSLMNAFLCAGAAVMSFLGALLVMAFGAVNGMKYTFIVAAIATLFITISGFSSLRRKS